MFLQSRIKRKRSSTKKPGNQHQQDRGTANWIGNSTLRQRGERADYALDYMPCNIVTPELRGPRSVCVSVCTVDPCNPTSLEPRELSAQTARCISFLISPSFGRRPSGGTAHGAGARPAARGAARGGAGRGQRALPVPPWAVCGAWALEESALFSLL